MSQIWGKLISINRKSVDKDYELSAKEIKMGRGEANEISIDNPKVSKLHCIFTQEDSGIFIEDKSSNGTYIENTLIGKDKKVKLNSGDIVYLIHKDKFKGKCEYLGFVFSQTNQISIQAEPDKDINSEIEKIKEKLKEAKEQKKKFAEELSENFKCLICLELIHQCATLNCFHNFCGGCISEYIVTSQTCPTCRQSIQYIQKNPAIQNTIDDIKKKQPSLKRNPEEYEELNLKNVITANQSTVSNLIREMKQKQSKGDYQGKLANIQERLQKRLTGEADSDYSYCSENEDEEDEKLKPEECPECKIARNDDQFKCAQNQAHVKCTSCKREFPDRPEKQDQRCILCQDPYCGIYLGVCRNNMSHTTKHDKYLTQFQNFKVPQKLAVNIFRNNKSELDILDQYLKQNKLSNQDIFEYMLTNKVSKDKFFFEKSKAILQNYNNPTTKTLIQPTSAVCSNCFPVIWYQIVFRYRIDIKNNLPQHIANRPLCHWGINCTTQATKQSHADTYDHICEQRRFA